MRTILAHIVLHNSFGGSSRSKHKQRYGFWTMVVHTLDTLDLRFGEFSLRKICKEVDYLESMERVETTMVEGTERTCWMCF